MNTQPTTCYPLQSIDSARSWEKFWRSDLASVDPVWRRGAVYLLRRLAHNDRANKDISAQRPLRFDALQLLLPLLDEEAVRIARGAEWSGREAEPDFDDTRWRIDLIRQAPATLLDRLCRSLDAVPPTPTFQLLVETFQLDPVEAGILAFAETVDALAPFGAVISRWIDRENRIKNLRALAEMLDAPPKEIGKRLAPGSRLTRLGLIVTDLGSVAVSDFVGISPGLGTILLAAPTTRQELIALLIEVIPGSASLPLTAFPHLTVEGARLVPTLQKAAHQAMAGINALLYGPPGTGKTEFAHAIADASGLRAYRVRHSDDAGLGISSEARMTAYVMVQEILRGQGDALIVFDECEGALSSSRHSDSADQAATERKGWMNQILETNPVPSIWIANCVERFDLALRRRFLLPVAFSIPPRAVRRQMVSHHLADTCLPATFLDELAHDAALVPAHYAAVRQMEKLVNSDLPLVRNGIGAIRCLSVGAQPPLERTQPLVVAPEFFNVAGQVNPQELIELLERRADVTICLHGLPGTGKTEFARFLAERLDRELVIRGASDLLSKYVGDTERLIAAMFEEVDPRHGMLFLDEVDSLLRKRTELSHGWEVSQVNELLQGMERFAGTLIIATNHIEALDLAVLRRVDFQLEFKPLRQDQRAALFARETAAEIPELLLRHLKAIDDVRLGDFAVVCRRRTLLGKSGSPDEFLRQLATEASARRKQRSVAHGA